MSCVPTNKVFFPTRITIDGKVPHKTFAKKSYKFSKLVKIEYPDSNGDGLYKIPKLNACIRKIAEKIKILQGLNIVECPSALLQRHSFVLKMIKGFRNIKSLTMPLHHLSKALLQSIIRWLNISKTLKSLSCNSQADKSIITKQKQSYEKLFRIIKLSKLERLGLNLSDTAAKELLPFLLFTYFPITLKRLSLDWESSISFSQITRQSYNRLVNGILSRYPNLEALTMKMPIDFDVLLTIFGIDASRFTNFRCLDLHIQDNELQNDTYSKVAKNFFAKCPNLESASFLFENSLPSLNFLSSLGICPLRHLFLALPLQDEDQMPLLGDCIGKLHHLETLKLKISGDISRYNASKYFKAFYNNLSQLRSIRILELCILTHTSGITKIPEVLKSLAQWLDNLPCLEELAFKHLQANFVEELGDLLQALSNKVENIKRFEINLEDQLLRQNTLMQLVQLIQDLKSLETLALDQLTFDGKRFTERFSKALIQSKSLKILRLFWAKGKIDSNLLREMIIGILTKPRFESMYFLPNREFKRIGETKASFLKTGVPVSELLAKNPKLRYVTAPSDIVSFNIDLALCKWC